MSGKTSKGWSKRKFNGEWAKALQNYLQKKVDEVPPGWVRSEEALRKMGYSGDAGGQRNGLLKKMVKEGILVQKEFRVFDGSGRRLSPIIHYKIA